jgi:hypothetical protein
LAVKPTPPMRDGHTPECCLAGEDCGNEQHLGTDGCYSEYCAFKCLHDAGSFLWYRYGAMQQYLLN